MLIAINTLIPVFLVIALGFGLQRMGLVTGAMWEGMERITYYVLFPILLVQTLATADFSGVPVLSMGFAMFLGTLTMSVVVLALRPLLMGAWKLPGSSFTSVFQGATRWHTFVALAVVGNLYGAPGISLASLGAAAMVPYLNIASVLVLSRWASPTRPSTRAMLIALAKNPFIVSCLIGIAINYSNVTIWAPLLDTMDILARAALGIGLVLVGAGLRLPEALSPRREILLTIALKLGLMPLLMFAWCTAFGVTGMALKVAVLCGSVQTAANSYVLARQMGGDAPLMSSIITMQSLFCMLTLPFLLWLMG
ncbi:transporter [Agaricicola taiwanensis]|uniref:Transporter n=1 Tax=Agaricicola taiwanensis TaxID=591372 RepID=A0A8J2YJV6_9RHOB|nr:AEC family transporter [Agaricicola taiwanensis]GGE47159.1 transporter [Agaricicola taiwanensis]